MKASASAAQSRPSGADCVRVRARVCVFRVSILGRLIVFIASRIRLLRGMIARIFVRPMCHRVSVPEIIITSLLVVVVVVLPAAPSPSLPFVRICTTAADVCVCVCVGVRWLAALTK